MARTIIAFLIGVVVLSIVVIARADPTNAADAVLQNLRLNAAGTQAAGPDKIRIPVPVDGVIYEVIGATPGEPKLVQVATQDPK